MTETFKEQLEAAFWSGVNTDVPENVVRKGPVETADFVKREFDFFYRTKYETN